MKYPETVEISGYFMDCVDEKDTILNERYNTKRPHRTLKNLTPCQMEENFSKNDS